MMPLVVAAFVFVSRNRLRDNFDRFMILAVHEFFVALELEQESSAVIVRRKKLPFITNQKAPAAGNGIHHLFNIRNHRFGRFVIAIMRKRVLGF